jgi:hypothetical protein
VTDPTPSWGRTGIPRPVPPTSWVRSGTSWTYQSKITGPDPGSSDYFGDSVSISGDGSYAIVGAHRMTRTTPTPVPPTSSAAPGPPGATSPRLRLRTGRKLTASASLSPFRVTVPTPSRGRGRMTAPRVHPNQTAVPPTSSAAPGPPGASRPRLRLRTRRTMTTSPTASPSRVTGPTPSWGRPEMTTEPPTPVPSTYIIYQRSSMSPHPS